MADFKRHRLGAPGPYSSVFSAVNFILNQSTDQAEWIFKAADAAILTKVGFRVGALTGTATTWKASLQGVDGATGFPDGTIKGGGSPASVTFTNSGLSANNWFWFSLANSYTCTRGEDLALVVAYDSGTAPSAAVNDLSPTMTGSWTPGSAAPYSIQNDNGTRTKGGGVPVFGYASSTKAYGYPMKAGYGQTVNSGSNPSEVAQRFLLPSTWGSTFTVAGVRMFWTPPAPATNSFILRLYDGTTVLQDVTIDDEITPGTTSRLAEFYFDESSLSTLNFGSEYRIAIAPQTATNMTVNGLTTDAQSDWGAYAGGQDFYVSTRNGGAWTDVVATRLMMDLIVDDWTVAAGGGTSVFVVEG